MPVEMVAVWLRWLMLVASMAEFRLLCLWLTWLWRSSSWTSFMGFSLRCLGSTGINVPCHPSLQWLFVTLAPDGALSVSVLVWLRCGRLLGLDRFGVRRALAPRCCCWAHVRHVRGHCGCEGAERATSCIVGVFRAAIEEVWWCMIFSILVRALWLCHLSGCYR